MKVSSSLGLGNKTKKVEKALSKRILLANNSINTKEGLVESSNPIFAKSSARSTYQNPDIRYQNQYQTTALNSINIRNMLFMFAENNEIKKALKIITNEIVVSNLKSNKYPVNPAINFSLIPEDKRDVAKAIQKYMNDVFFPKIWRWLNFDNPKELPKIIKEYMTTGKLAFEIVYDNLKRPKNIVNMYPIDPAGLQKFVENGQVFFVFKQANGGPERILHENQIILVEWNEYDFGHVSYVDQLRRPFNIMRGMQTAKQMWFAAKSQVRLHINLNLGDMPRKAAIQTIEEKESEIMSTFEYSESDGKVLYNGETDVIGYNEFITAETANSGKPEIDEIVGNGPDMTEIDSLQYWEKLYWKETNIPYDRIDPSSTETWGFSDASQIKKSEINFSKDTLEWKNDISQIFLKALIIQLTLQEAEIGVDLSLLDSIYMNWITFNEYEKPAELEMLEKQITLAQTISTFGEQEDSEGRTRKQIPYQWIIENYLNFTTEQLETMKQYRLQTDVELGFITKDGEIIKTEETEKEEFSIDEQNFVDGDFADDNLAGISATDDENY